MACSDDRRPRVKHDPSSTHGGLYAWEFEHDGRELAVRVDRQVIVNDIALALQAARDGVEIAYPPEEYVEAGRLQRLLADGCPPFPGYHLYYPSRRQLSPAMAVLIEALRGRGRRSMIADDVTTDR